ncbi:TerD family protein [Jiangella alkaliphila]|uniref:TerD domain-containing protein n=1 Tax=Jiangella alkaliphila TaxID=419479 RepID=A0A1H2G5Z0_9ACTN|nr:hypothetical protein SAMN04488563_0309 [Jiangella alkaliphila]
MCQGGRVPTIEPLLIRKTLRVPAVAGPPGDGAVVARQLDAVLTTVGFKAARDLLEHLSGLDVGTAIDRSVLVLGTVRELVGDHVEHNAYFIDFPAGVPDTVEFWITCLRDAIERAAVPDVLSDGDGSTGGLPISLLDLPAYGRYQHTYAELLAAHDELIPSLKDRVTVLRLGRSLAEETHELYLALAGSPVPLGDDDLAALADLARLCLDDAQPETVPMRESRAVVNRVRLEAGRPLLADTVTDVLRLACALSDGDVTLEKPTRFASFRRAQRRALLTALDAVVADSPAKLADVHRHREAWKRLGERLHPHEYPALSHARDVFAVARREKTARSLSARAEVAFAAGDVRAAVTVLSAAPGLLVRALDRILRTAAPDDLSFALETVEEVAGRVSGRVLLSLREHLANRSAPEATRFFVNRSARAWSEPDLRPPLESAVVERLTALLDGEIVRRLPERGTIVVDPQVLDLAVPLSDKTAGGGFGVMARGSVVPVDGPAVRFFTYWRQQRVRTDFDLSVALLDADFESAGHVSWTNLADGGAIYSGDITEAPDGASEFIDMDLSAVTARYVVPEILVYSGEGFDTVAESFFGFMIRDPAQAGRPFEPRTVRMKSDLRGTGRVAVPLLFARADDGTWSARWMQVYLRGAAWGNTVEGIRVTASALARAIDGRSYLRMSHLVDLMAARGGTVTVSPSPAALGLDPGVPVTYVGIEVPDGLPAGSDCYGLDRHKELIPQ